MVYYYMSKNKWLPVLHSNLLYEMGTTSWTHSTIQLNLVVFIRIAAPCQQHDHM